MQIGILTEHAGSIDERVAEEYQQCQNEELTAALEVAHGDDAHHAGYQLVEYELVRVGYQTRQYYHRRQVYV